MPNVAYHADIAEMRGKQADQVYTRARSGPTRRSRVAPVNPRTPAQAQVRANLGHASNAYRGLDADQAVAWANYARTQTAHNPLTGFAYVPSANTVFTGLAAKFLQITPGGTIPLTPPVSGFVGDTIALSVEGAGGSMLFTASAVNAAGVKTELLVQRLASPMRTPNPRGYRSRMFHGFAAGGLDLNVSADPGVYAVAYRFVRPASGQDSPLIEIGVVTVS